MIKIYLDPEPYDPADYSDIPEIVEYERAGFASGELSVYVVESLTWDYESVDLICCVVADSGLEGRYESAYDIPNEHVRDIAIDLES